MLRLIEKFPLKMWEFFILKAELFMMQLSISKREERLLQMCIQLGRSNHKKKSIRNLHCRSFEVLACISELNYLNFGTLARKYLVWIFWGKKKKKIGLDLDFQASHFTCFWDIIWTECKNPVTSNMYHSPASLTWKNIKEENETRTKRLCLLPEQALC